MVPIGDVINKKLITNIEFQNNIGGNKTQAVIQFRDRTGKPMINSKINWEFVSGWETFDKGKAETDGLGKVTINLSAKEKANLEKGQLKISIQENKNEKPLSSSFLLKNAL